MAVFNPIEYDGRVQRATAVLSESFDITLVCLEGPEQVGGWGCAVRRIRADRWRGPLKHVYFWALLLWATVMLRPRVVYTHDYYLSLPGLLAARLVGAAWIHDVHELIVDRSKSPRLRSRVWYMVEACVLKRADAVVSTNRWRSKLLRRWYGLATPMVVVRNISADPDKRPLSKSSTFSSGRHGATVSKADTWVVYQGVMRLDRGLDRFLCAFRYLPRNYRLLLVGSGPDVEMIHRSAIENGVEDSVEVRERVQRSQLRAIIRGCDIGIVSYGYHSLNQRYCESNKLWEYLQEGVPVVATDQVPLAAVLSRFHVGELIRRQDSSYMVANKLRTVAAERLRYEDQIAQCIKAHPWCREAAALTMAVQSVS